MKVLDYREIPEEKVQDPEAKDVFIRVLVGPHDNAGKFHMRRFRVLPGGHTPLHTHPWEHGVFVLAGQGEVALPEGPKEIKPGFVVFIPPRVEHQFRNTGPEELVFICVIPAPES